MKDFDEHFPSLERKYAKYKMPEGRDAGDLIFTHKQHIINNCLDKQKVKEAIDKVFELDDEEGKVHNEMIKKELGLCER